MRLNTPDTTPEARHWKSLSRQALEREYSPSSVLGGNYQPFIDEYRIRSNAARERCADLKTLRYGDGLRHLVDVVPASPVGGQSNGKSPLLVYIHGGYWQEGCREDSLFGADWFSEQGVAYAAIGYSLAPGVTLAEIVDECRQAVVCIERHAEALGIDEKNIVVAGSSAGAHLAALCCVTESTLAASASNPIAGLVLMSGIYDLEPLRHTYVNDALAMTAREARCLSPIQHSLTAFPDTVVCWGEQETNEFKRQSRLFANGLRAADVGVHEIEMPGMNHFNIVHCLADQETEIGRRVLSLLGV